MPTGSPEQYLPPDERSWLHCRALAFLDTAYYDDVMTRKPDQDAAVQLVIRQDERVAGHRLCRGPSGPPAARPGEPAAGAALGRLAPEATSCLHVYANEYAGDLEPGLVEALRSVSGLRPVQIFAHAPMPVPAGSAQPATDSSAPAPGRP